MASVFKISELITLHELLSTALRQVMNYARINILGRNPYFVLQLYCFVPFVRLHDVI